MLTFEGPPGHIVSLSLDVDEIVLLARTAVTVSGNGWTIDGNISGLCTLNAGDARRFTNWHDSGGWHSAPVDMPKALPAAPVAGSGIAVVAEAPVHVVRDETRSRGGSHVRSVVRAAVQKSNGTGKVVR
jgi:hypothetical protein